MKVLFRYLFVALLCALSFHGALFAADLSEGAGGEERYKRVFAARDFRTNQDGTKFEIPEKGAYKIQPRLKNTAIWTHFQVPPDVQSRNEWTLNAVVRSSEGSAAGVGLWMGNNGYCFYLYPDGKGSLQYYDGKKSTWRTNVDIKNFGYPANLSLRRDANGSIVAEVNGMVAAVRLLAIDIKEPKISDITSVSFATHSPASLPKRGSVAASYERLELEAWGVKATPDTFEDRFPNQTKQ